MPTYIHIKIHAHIINSYIHTYMLTYLHAYIRMHTSIHTCIHICNASMVKVLFLLRCNLLVYEYSVSCSLMLSLHISQLLPSDSDEMHIHEYLKSDLGLISLRLKRHISPQSETLVQQVVSPATAQSHNFIE